MADLDTPRLLLSEWSAELTTRSGIRLKVRPAAPDDEPILEAFFGRVTPEDLRFRFLSAVKKPGHDLVAPLVEVDHTSTENLLAFGEDGTTLLATAMIAAEPGLERAEVAIAVSADSKHRGIGWTLLDHVARYAAERGIGTLESIESRDNREAIGLEREMGFTAEPYPGDSTLVLLRKRLR
jgi:ribosomal protein S18 acetylase RimI-like enzyme